MKRFGLCAILVILSLSFLPACTAGIPSEEAPSEDDVASSWLILPTMPSPPEAALCHGGPADILTSKALVQPPAMDEPTARIPFRDPSFGACLVRVTDRTTDIAAWDVSAGLKNEYSRVQSFNVDGSLILVRGLEATWYIFSAQSLSPLGQVPLEIEPRWSATDPSLLYFTSETSIMSYDLKTGETAAIHNFSNEYPEAVMVWTRHEGSPSANGETWGLMAEDEDWLTSALIIYDLPSDTITATRDLSDWTDEEREMDSVTISPLGNYYLVQMDKYCEPGSLGTDAKPCGLMVYNRDLQNGRGLLRIVGHSDTALDTAGREVFVYQDIDTDTLSMIDLESGKITPLLTLDFSYTGFGLHISGRSFARPGWAVVSTHDGDARSHIWMDDSVFLVELKADGRTIQLAHTHSVVDETMEHDYWAEPQASADPSLEHVLFTTNWGRSGSEAVEMYMIELTDIWSSLAP